MQGSVKTDRKPRSQKVPNSRPAKIAFPITPSGASSLLDVWTEPTHRVVGQSLWIAFECDPDVVREYVPEPLELDGSGLVYLYAFDALGYSDRSLTEFVSPARVSFAETMFWIPCTWQGARYTYTPFTWTNRDFLAYFGRLLGMPQKVGRIEMSRFHPAEPTFNEPHEGVRIALSVEKIGLVLRAYVDLQSRVDEMPMLIDNHGFLPQIGRRHFYDVVKSRMTVDDLVVHFSGRVTPGPIWAGDAWLRFYEAENEEAIRFQPTKVVGAWAMSLSFVQPTGIGHPPQVLFDFITEDAGSG